MKLAEIIEGLSLETFGGDASDAEVTGGYVGDLLSHVLSSAGPGDLWITIQHHANVVAVAQVVGLAAILIADGKTPDEEVLRKASEAGLPLLGSSKSGFELCASLSDLLAARR